MSWWGNVWLLTSYLKRCRLPLKMWSENMLGRKVDWPVPLLFVLKSSCRQVRLWWRHLGLFGERTKLLWFCSPNYPRLHLHDRTWRLDDFSANNRGTVHSLVGRSHDLFSPFCPSPCDIHVHNTGCAPLGLVFPSSVWSFVKHKSAGYYSTICHLVLFNKIRACQMKISLLAG